MADLADTVSRGDSRCYRRALGRRPFVGCSGTDRHIFDLTVPIHDERHFLGIASTDVTASRMEELATPGLRALPGDAALLNASERWSERADEATLLRWTVLPLLPDP